MLAEATIEAVRAIMPLGESAPASRPDDFAERRAEALAAVADPELVTVFVASETGAQAEFHGHKGFAEGWDDWVQAFASVVAELEERIVTDDKIVLLTRQTARLPDSDRPFGGEAAAVLSFRDDRLVRVEFHLDRSAALRSAGLSA